MATYFLDPEDGNDANDGTTFANRKKTLAGFTAGILTPGDTIRLIASPDPTSLGSATWTDNDGTVVLASACTQLIDDGETAWTASANVTATANAAQRKHGATSAQMAIASGFTTGLIAYRALPATLDLSGYEQISFWMRTSLSTAASSYRLDLCSDAVGAVPVNSFTIDQTMVGAAWRVVVRNNGAALGSTINSIALVALLDPGTVTVNLDNITACKAPSAADSLTHLSLIGKNTVGEPEWYPILSIDGVDIEIGGCSGVNINSAATTPRPYRGTTESVTAYKLQPIDGVNRGGSSYPFIAANNGATESSDEATPNQLSGGWDRTAMSSQTGVSWVTGSHLATHAFNMNRDWWTVTKLGAAHFLEQGIDLGSSPIGMDIQMEGTVGCGTGAAAAPAFGAGSTNLQTSKYDIGNVVHCATGIWAQGYNLDLAFRRVTGVWLSTGYACRVNDGSNATTSIGVNKIRMTGKIDNCVPPIFNWSTQLTSPLRFIGNGGSVGENSTSVIRLDASNGNFQLLDCDMAATSTGGTDITWTASGLHEVMIHRDTSGVWSQRARFYDFGQATDQRHTASGYAWKLTGTAGFASSWRQTKVPWSRTIARKAVSNGVTYNISCWVRRDHATDYTPGIQVLGGSVIGIPDDVRSYITVGANTWEQITVSVTPTEDGVIEVQAICYAGNAIIRNCWWDDLDIT